MSEMVEKVAMALYLLDRSKGAIGTFQAQKKEWEEKARIVIEAMREPTPSMVHPDGFTAYGTPNFSDSHFNCHRADDSEGIWKLMIDEALK